jgi:O-antigen/teichoic acid export membrane protein
MLQVAVLASLGRLLSPADFGVVGAAMIVVNLALLFSKLGLGPALIQRENLTAAHIETAFFTSIVFGSVLALIVWAFAPAWAGLLGIPAAEPVLRGVAAIFPIKGLNTVAESLMQRDLRFRQLVRIEITSYGFGYALVATVMAANGFGAWSLVAAYLAQALVSTTQSLLAYRPPRPRFNTRAFKDLVGYGGGITVGRLINYLALNADNFVVGRVLGPAALGSYGRAYQLMSLPVRFIASALDVLFPVLSRVQVDLPRLQRAFLRSLGAIALLTFPITALVVVGAPEIVVILLGPKWDQVVPPLQVLSLGIFLRSSYRLSDAISYAKGAVYRRAHRQATYAAAVFLGAWIGSRFGITGVAWGVLLALTVHYTLMTHLSLRLLNLGWNKVFNAQLPGMLLALALIIMGWPAAALMRQQGHLAWLTILTVSLLMVATGLLLVRSIPKVFLGEAGHWAWKTFVDTIRRRINRGARPPTPQE